MEKFVIGERNVDITLDNGTVKKVDKKYLENMIGHLDEVETMEDAVQVWLEEEGYEINEDLEALDKKEKVKTIARAERKPKAKTQKERTIKENPTKEMIIAEIAKILPSFAENVVVENKGKLITFRIGEDEFKIDLVQKRKSKKEA